MTGMPLPNLGADDGPKVRHDFWLRHHDHLPNGPQQYFTMPPDFVSFLSHYGNAKNSCIHKFSVHVHRLRNINLKMKNLN